MKEPLPPDYELWRHDDEEHYQCFVQKSSGEVTIYDPSLPAEALFIRDVGVRIFRLL